eukprot:SAG25_NODE_394_length_8562_cov_23.502539_4_plen_329_part_00
MNINAALQALMWGLFAALSLPLGAAVGLLASPITQRTVAACMAFGAGALLFAIAIELYGEAVADLRLPDSSTGRFELLGLSLATVIGAIVYTCMDRFLLHRPTVSLNSLGRFGLEGPRASPRPEWTEAVREAEREAPLLGGGDVGGGGGGPARARRGSVNVDITDDAPLDADEEAPVAPPPRTPTSERSFAIILWFASWLDTLPQAILIGLLTAEKNSQGESRVHVSFVLAAFLANFPQSLASASLLAEFRASPIKVLLSWSLIWLVSAGVAFLVALITPANEPGLPGEDRSPGEVFKLSVVVGVSGLTGGAMIAFVSATVREAAAPN